MKCWEESENIYTIVFFEEHPQIQNVREQRNVVYSVDLRSVENETKHKVNSDMISFV